jgi:hypothetical protein
MLGDLVSGGEFKSGRARDSSTELAESFRKASKALDTVARDFVALRQRVKPPSR